MRFEDLADPPAWAGLRTRRLLVVTGTLSGQRRLRGLVSCLLVAAVLGFLVVGANGPRDPYLTNQYLPGTGPAAPAGRGAPVPGGARTPGSAPARGLSHP